MNVSTIATNPSTPDRKEAGIVVGMVAVKAPSASGDGGFGAGPEQWQHAANAVFRAVENGVPLVRCANNGLTCWIDPLGRVRQYFGQESGNIYGGGFVTFEVPLGQALGQTAYNRHGDLCGGACLVVAVVGGAARRLAKRGLHTGGGIG